MKDEKEVREVFSRSNCPTSKWRGSIGPFDWFLLGFMAAEKEAILSRLTELDKIANEVRSERLILKSELECLIKTEKTSVP